MSFHSRIALAVAGLAATALMPFSASAQTRVAAKAAMLP
jgi:hypothetical protein